MNKCGASTTAKSIGELHEEATRTRCVGNDKGSSRVRIEESDEGQTLSISEHKTGFKEGLECSKNGQISVLTDPEFRIHQRLQVTIVSVTVSSSHRALGPILSVDFCYRPILKIRTHDVDRKSCQILNRP